MDDLVGMVVDELTAAKKIDDTYIFYSSDHGYKQVPNSDSACCPSPSASPQAGAILIMLPFFHDILRAALFNTCSTLMMDPMSHDTGPVAGWHVKTAPV